MTDSTPTTAAVKLPGDVFDQMLTALREVRTFVHVETGHKPTVTELERVIQLAQQSWRLIP